MVGCGNQVGRPEFIASRMLCQHSVYQAQFGHTEAGCVAIGASFVKFLDEQRRIFPGITHAVVKV